LWFQPVVLAASACDSEKENAAMEMPMEQKNLNITTPGKKLLVADPCNVEQRHELPGLIQAKPHV
jgi:hypothetical protein